MEPGKPEHPAGGMVLTPPLDRPSVLLEIAHAVVIHPDPASLLRELAAVLRTHLRVDYLSFSLLDSAGRAARLQVLQPIDSATAPNPADTPSELPAGESPTAVIYETQQPLWLFVDQPDGQFPTLRAALRRQGVSGVCFVPLTTARRRLGAMAFTSYQPVVPAPGDLDFLTEVGRLVALAVEVTTTRQELERANDRLARLTTRLAQEKRYLEEEIRAAGRFDEILGVSSDLKDVLRQVEVVAPTDSAVLVTGETGTGKELVARAVHRLSTRRDRTFVKLNCAAIPTGLLESELFGHERGAFTGAVERRLGRFELADGGTLFLDEVGDIPADLQPKLLRVLQEQEFERIGSGKTIKVDVRLVAATHRDLGRMVADGRFRADLFYRLHVFPIAVPPLRHRHEDIPLLVKHFTRLFAQRIGKEISSVPVETMERLQRYQWPGNIRELEHLIERAVILSPGPELRVPEIEMLSITDTPADHATSPLTSLKNAERETILRVLQECRWRIGGTNGAAARLGIKRTTLLSRLKKLGIERPLDNEVSKK
jgi:formate hydrogenlyase transcriptional activator